MKRLLIPVLLVLWMVPYAYAPVPHKEEVLIYSFTEKSTEYTCDINGITDMNLINSIEWDKSIKNSTGYLIVQWNSSISINIWTVNTGKRNDISPDGKMHKYAKAEFPVEYSIAQANVGKNTTWLVGSSSDLEHILLTGDEKRIKILDKGGDAATKLAGTHTWYYTDPKSIMHVGSSVISLRWHSKFTADYFYDPGMLDGWDATDQIMDYLRNKGYIIIPTGL
jgi:hypothetical protein